MNEPFHKSPAFQLYVDDLIAGTMNFTDAELGLYLRLLCAQWNDGSLPDDARELASYGRGRTPLARVRAKFAAGPDGRLRNARLERVRAEQGKFRSNRSEAGRLGAEKRWHTHDNTDGKGMAKPMAKLLAKPLQNDDKMMTHTMANDSSPSPSPSPLSKASDKACQALEKGDGKGMAKRPRLTPEQALTAGRLERCLGVQWANDAGKWIGRARSAAGKAARVAAELDNAQREGRINTTPAQYAEQIWKEFA